MKKFLLFLCAVTCFASVPVSASDWIKGPVVQKPDSEMRKADTASDNSIVFGYCQDLYMGIGVGASGVTLKGAIEIPQDVATAWAGNEITGLQIAYGTAAVRSITLFITDNLYGDPLYTESATVSTLNGWNDFKLTTPFEIPASTFYIGYQVRTRSDQDYPIGVDGVATQNYLGGYVAVDGEWDNLSEYYGSVCLRAVIEGAGLLSLDASLQGISVPEYVKPGDAFSVSATVMNQGISTITSLKVDARVGENTFEGLDVSLPSGGIASGKSAPVTVGGLYASEEAMAMPVELSVSRVNGTDDENAVNNTATASVMSLADGFTRNVVFEEWTGTWCGWCVRGIAGMGYMREKYGDKGFIGIAVHGGDVMQTASYEPFLSRYGGSYPGCVVNRTYTFDPSSQSLEYYFLQQQAIPAVAQLRLNAEYSKASPFVISVSADMEFAVDVENLDCKLAFVITENNVGPYPQSNYYAGGSNGPMDGWENEGSRVTIYFNEVARNILSCDGIENSVPQAVEKGKTYTFSTEVPVTNITNINNCEMAVIMINSATGRIENGAQIHKIASVADAVTSSGAVAVSGGVNAVTITGQFRTATVYSADGAVWADGVTAPSVTVAPGLYIVKVECTDGNVVCRKVIVR